MNQTLALSRYGSDLAQAGQNLLAQKTRSILTALGIIFGVGAVIGMLAIGAGARAESLRFIEQLGVRNLLVASRAATSDQELQQRRRSSPGLTERDVRILEANVDSLETLSPRKGLHPSSVLPKPSRDMPELFGVRPSYALIHNWQLAEGRVFTPQDNEASAAVCVLGEAAKVSLFGYTSAVGKFVKVNDTWLEVIGVLKEQIASGSSLTQDPNQVIYTPLQTVQYRFFDISGYLRDELDGVDVRLKPTADSVEASKIVVAILNSTHHNTPDFAVTIPAELLAEQQRSQAIFTYVMVAIAAISLLSGASAS
jgi:putative ABC transport system permease protein